MSGVKFPKSSVEPSVYKSCVQVAADRGRMLIEQMVHCAVEDIQRRIGILNQDQERRVLNDARELLQRHQGALYAEFPAVLRETFAQALAGVAKRATEVDSMTLVNDHQMKVNVSYARATQAVMGHVDGELTELDALMCSARGLASVQVDQNVLRPGTYIRALYAVVMRSPVPEAIRQRWMHHLTEAMGQALIDEYRHLCEVLRTAGVQKVGYTVASAPSTVRLPVADPHGSSQAQPLNVQALHQLLGRTETAVTPIWTRPGVDAATPALSQAAATEVVSMLLHSALAEGALLLPIQETLLDLQPALLKLAMVDSAFWSDRNHSARALLREVTQRSRAWVSEDQPGFAGFLRNLRQAVDALSQESIESGAPFQQALEWLLDSWDEPGSAFGALDGEHVLQTRSC